MSLDPALRALLTDTRTEGTWRSTDGRATVTYHRRGDRFTWTVDGKTGSSDMTEDVLHALDPESR